MDSSCWQNTCCSFDIQVVIMDTTVADPGGRGHLLPIAHLCVCMYTTLNTLLAKFSANSFYVKKTQLY